MVLLIQSPSELCWDHNEKERRANQAKGGSQRPDAADRIADKDREGYYATKPEKRIVGEIEAGGGHARGRGMTVY